MALYLYNNAQSACTSFKNRFFYTGIIVVRLLKHLVLDIWWHMKQTDLSLYIQI